jgi:protein-L-isoaspartate(D-aspartate) O-methyltransferase
MPNLCRVLLDGAAVVAIPLLLLHCGGGNENHSLSPDPNRHNERDRMVARWVMAGGVTDKAVLAAMRRVPRHAFVPKEYAGMAYEDRALPIGHEQSISQPSLVAYMIETLELRGDEKVLEIGTGSGYQAAVLAELVPQVFTIEIIPPLAKQAQETLADLDYQNIRVRTADGYRGWPEEAPFDAIIMTAAPLHIPPPLLEQLAVGGRLITPIGGFIQDLVLVRRTATGYERKRLLPVRFVPMTGEAEQALPTP